MCLARCKGHRTSTLNIMETHMKRSIMFGVLFLTALAVAASAQSTGGQTPSQSGSSDQVTVTGCLRRGDAGSTGAGATGAAGSGGSRGGFVLTNAKMGSGSTSRWHQRIQHPVRLAARPGHLPWASPPARPGSSSRAARPICRTMRTVRSRSAASSIRPWILSRARPARRQRALRVQLGQRARVRPPRAMRRARTCRRFA